ncbi:hypothetical protein [Photobacterium sp. TY1-4]|uniref:hypothetical protein n=1 Tax=Photobacterium sp. TY1-4 TaxID=2899122 RepID=UPI0021BE106C|nr:hypothetical protein [Photobacterium sp. TY1-4]UXI00448.1 hypothetical protein NH461_11570 [Photobacterium sp. TY1-4]
MEQLKTTVKDDRLIVEIPAEYIENAFEMGVTTNVTGTVTDRQAMLSHFAAKLNDGAGDSHFGRFVDAVCEEALEDGELFVECDDVD